MRELEKYRVLSGEGRQCGRVKDIYFDDFTWGIARLVLSIEPQQHGQKLVLIEPEQVQSISAEEQSIRLTVPGEELEGLPLASSVLPVCRQYASLALASPGASNFGQTTGNNDPHLRSTRAVTNYCITAGGEFAGKLVDLVFNDEQWEIRYLQVEQMVERKKLRFYVSRQSIERFTWSTQRVVLKDLQPVELASGEFPISERKAA